MLQKKWSMPRAFVGATYRLVGRPQPGVYPAWGCLPLPVWSSLWPFIGGLHKSGAGSLSSFCVSFMLRPQSALFWAIPLFLHLRQPFLWWVGVYNLPGHSWRGWLTWSQGQTHSALCICSPLFSAWGYIRACTLVAMFPGSQWGLF